MIGLSAFWLTMGLFLWQLVQAWHRELPERVESVVLGQVGGLWGEPSICV